jgi:putative ABC transport system permease protein
VNIVTLAISNAGRNKFRSSLTVLGVAMAIVAFVFLRTVITAWNTGADHAAKDRIATRHKLSFVIQLPKRYIDTIRETEGVSAATWCNWFGAKDAKNPDNFFATLACDPESLLEVYDEIVLGPGVRERWLEDRRGAIIGDALAKNLGVGVGDTVTLSGTIYPGNWVFNVAGIYGATRRSIDRNTFFFHWDYMNESLPETRRDQIGWVIARIDRASEGPSISSAIDRTFESRDVPTITMSERALNLSFMGMFSALLTAIDVISIVILAILVLILGNTIAMGVRERAGEFAVLRAIGFLPRHVVIFIVSESIVIGLLAGSVGLAIAYPLVDLAVGRFIEENMGGYFPYFRIEASTVILSLILTVVLGMLAALIPAIRSSHIRVTDALRRVA